MFIINERICTPASLRPHSKHALAASWAGKPERRTRELSVLHRSARAAAAAALRSQFAKLRAQQMCVMASDSDLHSDKRFAMSHGEGGSIRPGNSTSS